MTQITAGQATAVLNSYNTAFAVARADLITATQHVYEDTAAAYIASQIKADLVTFYTALLGTFPDQTPGNHPCANWIAVIAGLTQKISVPIPNLADFNVLVQAVYKFLWLTQYLSTN